MQNISSSSLRICLIFSQGEILDYKNQGNDLGHFWIDWAFQANLMYKLSLVTLLSLLRHFLWSPFLNFPNTLKLIMTHFPLPWTCWSFIAYTLSHVEVKEGRSVRELNHVFIFVVQKKNWVNVESMWWYV